MYNSFSGLGITVTASVAPVFSNHSPQFITIHSINSVSNANQWCRSVVKYGGQRQSGQAIKLFHLTPYVKDFQTLNNPGSWQPVGASKKIVLPSIFDTYLSSLMTWNLQSYPTTVLTGRMWHFRGSKHTLIPPTYFQGVGTPQPPGSTPLGLLVYSEVWSDFIICITVS